VPRRARRQRLCGSGALVASTTAIASAWILTELESQLDEAARLRAASVSEWWSRRPGVAGTARGNSSERDVDAERGRSTRAPDVPP
jgi:hypothetical protein